MFEFRPRRGDQTGEIHRLWRWQKIPGMRRVPARRRLLVASAAPRRRPHLDVVDGLLEHENMIMH
jgi:hypothetical protein